MIVLRLLTKMPICNGRNGLHSIKYLSTSKVVSSNESCKVLIVGGGTGGCALAAKLSSKLKKNDVVILEPADKHYYQPMFTLIGGGMKKIEQSYKPMSKVLPKNAKWVKEKAIEFDPNLNTVRTESGSSYKYDLLLIATGLKLNYDKIPGLVTALKERHSKVCSIYSPDYAENAYDSIKHAFDGNAIFTFPASPVKCPGAPQKIMYIAEHYFRKFKKRRNFKIIYNTSLPVLFGCKHYADALWKIVEERDIKVNLKRNLIEVKPELNIAVFENLDNPKEKFEEKYSLLHAVPPMSTPSELARCRELVNESGFVEVSKSTMQHVKYDNVFAIGDCASSPNSKTAASAAAQAPVVFNNMMARMKGHQPTSIYNGYASCPLVTGYDKCILAEFDYNLQPLETFPFPQNKERYSMFLMKKDFMPIMYWGLMVKGLWNGPSAMRNYLSIFNFYKKDDPRKLVS